MQARVTEQVFFDDIRSHHQVADVLGDHHQRRRQDGEDGEPFKTRGVERRQREPVRLADRGQIHHAHKERQRIPYQHTDQDRDNRQKTAEQHGTQDGHTQRHQRDSDGSGVCADAVSRQQARHVRRHTGQFQADDRHNRPHRRRRENDVQPAGTGFFNQQRDQAKQHPAHDKTTQRHFITRRQQQQHRGNERKAGAEIGRDLALADKQVQQGSDAVKQQHRRRVNLEQNRHQHGRAKHGEQVLEAERNSLE
ncbi:hypothetical protein D3C72_1316380 [compost metagenome]